MSNNPYSEEPRAQSADRERMEDLPLRPPPPQVQQSPLATDVSPDADNEETRHEEALQLDTLLVY